MKRIMAAALIVGAVGGLGAQEIDYPELWAKATPFHEFLEGVRARQEQWRSRFANAAIEPEALDAARALPGRRQILAIAEARCSDSVWAVPYLAKLAAAVPEKIELRVISAAQGRNVQARHLTPDQRQATPTIVVLDENGRFVGAWVERPAELQKWYLENKPSLDRDELYERVAAWYEQDAGKSTVSEVLAIMRREPVEKH